MQKRLLLLPGAVVVIGLILAGCTIPESWRLNKDDNAKTESNNSEVDTRVEVPSATDIETSESEEEGSPDVLVPDTNNIENETNEAANETEEPVDSGNSTTPYTNEPFTIQ